MIGRVDVFDQDELDAVPFGHVAVLACGNEFQVSGSLTVKVVDDAVAYASDGATVYAGHGWPRVFAHDRTSVYATLHATVTAFDSTTIHAAGRSTVKAHDNSVVHARGSAHVEAFGRTTVHAYGTGVTVNATEGTTVHRYTLDDDTKEG